LSADSGYKNAHKISSKNDTYWDYWYDSGKLYYAVETYNSNTTNFYQLDLSNGQKKKLKTLNLNDRQTAYMNGFKDGIIYYDEIDYSSSDTKIVNLKTYNLKTGKTNTLFQFERGYGIAGKILYISNKWMIIHESRPMDSSDGSGFLDGVNRQLTVMSPADKRHRVIVKYFVS